MPSRDREISGVHVISTTYFRNKDGKIIIKYYRLSHDVVTLDVSRDVSTENLLKNRTENGCKLRPEAATRFDNLYFSVQGNLNFIRK